MQLHTLQPDYLLNEYRIVKLLGEGGFGLTYLAFDTNLEKKVAIKEYMPSEHSIREKDSQIIAKSDSSKKKI
jgi:serine/threonine protein kinase